MIKENKKYTFIDLLKLYLTYYKSFIHLPFKIQEYSMF